MVFGAGGTAGRRSAPEASPGAWGAADGIGTCSLGGSTTESATEAGSGGMSDTGPAALSAKATGGSNDQGGKFYHRQQKVIAGAESLICHHLLHLIQPFK